jgi:hypothetical protein
MSTAKAAPRCPDCDVAMEEGFLVDNVNYGAVPARWHRGQPKVIFLGAGPGTLGNRMMEVIVHRCTDCGLLRSYAQAKKWRKVD